MKPILVATDGSEGARHAVDAAADLAGKLNIDLWILNVMDGFPDEELVRFTRAEGASVGDALDARAKRILTEARARAERFGAKTIHLRSRSGDCTEVILETAREIEAAAIFVGRRGRGRLPGLLLGSVSQKLACLAPCQLVIVP
jgi:nucleotide-binding universal stress UspA family protein